MGLIRCINKKIQPEEETVLWENPSPTSNFSAQTATLSDDMTNYSFLRVEGTVTKSNTYPIEVYCSPSYLFTCSASKSTLGGSCALCGSDGSYRYERSLSASSSTPFNLKIGNAYKLAYNASAVSNVMIPTRVIGIK